MIKIKTKVSYLLFYIIFLIPSFLLTGLIFTTFIAKHLWYEWDSLPIIDLITFPSVHTQAGAHFIAPPVIVYLTWIFFLAIPFVVPALITRLVIKERKNLLPGS